MLLSPPNVPQNGPFGTYSPKIIAFAAEKKIAVFSKRFATDLVACAGDRRKIGAGVDRTLEESEEKSGSKDNRDLSACA